MKGNINCVVGTSANEGADLSEGLQGGSGGQGAGRMQVGDRGLKGENYYHIEKAESADYWGTGIQGPL